MGGIKKIYHMNMAGVSSLKSGKSGKSHKGSRASGQVISGVGPGSKPGKGGK